MNSFIILPVVQKGIRYVLCSFCNLEFDAVDLR